MVIILNTNSSRNINNNNTYDSGQNNNYIKNINTNRKKRNPVKSVSVIRAIIREGIVGVGWRSGV